jgi:uncharacterized ion transporter superfamily protein YfcC
LKQNPGESGDKKKQNLSVKKDALWPTLINDLSLTYEQDEKLKALYKSGESKASKSERRKIALAVVCFKFLFFVFPLYCMTDFFSFFIM